MSLHQQHGGSAAVMTRRRMRGYSLYGKRVLSEVRLPIPELPRADFATHAWIVRRGAPFRASMLPRLQPIAEDKARDGTVLDRFYRSGDDAWLWDHRIGLFHLEAQAGRVTVFPTPGADEDDLGLVILGPVFSFMLHQAGLPNLHASAVVTEHGASAFIGPSTFGKSTLAAGLLRAGARLLTDDILPLHFGRNGIYGIPGPAMMKLWPTTARHTLGIADRLPPLTSYTDKRLLEPQSHHFECENRATLLRAIYVPRRVNPVAEGQAETIVEHLGLREAVLALLSQTFRGHYLYPHELASLLEQFGRLVRHVRVAILHVPHGLEHRDAVTARILRDLASA